MVHHFPQCIYTKRELNYSVPFLLGTEDYCPSFLSILMPPVSFAIFTPLSASRTQASERVGTVTAVIPGHLHPQRHALATPRP